MSNIVGEGLSKEINDQIKIRQEKYGKLTERTTEELLYFNQKSAFVKCVSSVNITDSYVPPSTDLQIILNEIKGSQLAKKFVLFAGTSESVDQTDGVYKQRGGISRDGSILNNRAYGLGGLDFGNKPMPGIVDMTMKNETRGSLKTGTIKIKAWNRSQFEIIDLLYLRLGYSILVEWGNNIYYNNKGEFISSNPYSLENEFLNGTLSTQGVLEKIQKYRLESNGNYDALYGKVVNFTWDLGTDGSYNITVIIRSIGDVIESLKVNVIGVNSEEADNSIDENTGGNGSMLSQYRSNSSTSGTTSSTQTTGFYEITNGMDRLTKYLYIFCSYFYKFTNQDRNAVESVKTFEPSNNPFLKTNLSVKNEGWGGATLKGGGVTGTVEDDYKNFFSQQYAGGSNNVIFHNIDFVRLGYLLKLIETKILPKYSGKEPLINFDTDNDSNLYAYLPGLVPITPGICQISQEIHWPTDNWTSSNGVEQHTAYGYLKGAEPGTVKINNISYGKLMNIYVSVNFITETITQFRDPQNSQTLFIDFIRKLLEGISGALGGYNNFEVVIDEISNTAYIIDEFPLASRDSVIQSLNKPIASNNAIIQLWGYDKVGASNKASFVREFGMSTSITPALSTMITIGAQAAGTAQNIDATALSSLNSGLIDRIKPTVTDSDVPTSGTESKEDKIKQLNNKYPDAWKIYNQIVKTIGTPLEFHARDFTTTNPVFTPKYTENAGFGLEFNNETSLSEQRAEPLSIIESLAQYVLAKNAIENEEPSGTIGFIPVSINLKLDGISGIKIYNGLTIDTTYLPSNYPRTMDFIITAVNHTIQNNDWTTQISTLMVPNLSKAPTIEDTGRDDSGIIKKASSNENNNSSQNTVTGGVIDEQTITSGWPLKSSSYSKKTSSKSQIILHWTAGSQKTDKCKSGVAALMDRNQNSATSAGGIDNPPWGLTYHYEIDANGHVEQLINENMTAYHASGANTNSIGISIQNIGWCKDANNSSYGPLAQDQTKAVKLVDFYGKEAPYRNITWNQEITDAQYNALLKLIQEIALRNPNIGSFTLNENTWNQMFPPNEKILGATTSYRRDVPGLYSHCSVTTAKLDCMPTPKIWKLLNDLSGKF